jgi:hypothetical protein
MKTTFALGTTLTSDRPATGNLVFLRESDRKPGFAEADPAFRHGAVDADQQHRAGAQRRCRCSPSIFRSAAGIFQWQRARQFTRRTASNKASGKHACCCCEPAGGHQSRTGPIDRNCSH